MAAAAALAQASPLESGEIKNLQNRRKNGNQVIVPPEYIGELTFSAYAASGCDLLGSAITQSGIVFEIGHSLGYRRTGPGKPAGLG